MSQDELIYDLRASVDIESQPGYSWVRVVTEAQPAVLQREFHKLRVGDTAVPALLVKSCGNSADPGLIPSGIATYAGDPTKTVQIPVAAAKPSLATLHYGEPPDVAVVVPLAPARISLADSNVLKVRMCRQDLNQLKREDYCINGFTASILGTDAQGSCIRVPIDHSQVVALNDNALHAWQTFLTMFIVPGFVVTFNVAPPDYIVVDNRRVLSSITASADLAKEALCARVHFLPAAMTPVFEAA